MIRLAKIWRTYHMGEEELHALADIDLEIESGEHVAIMGPSGSGKSTLLNIIGLLDRATAGRYELDGRDVTDLSDDELSAVRQTRIGFVFQSYHLVPRLDATGNVELPMVFAGVPRKERRERARGRQDGRGFGQLPDREGPRLQNGEDLGQRVPLAAPPVHGQRAAQDQHRAADFHVVLQHVLREVLQHEGSHADEENGVERDHLVVTAGEVLHALLHGPDEGTAREPAPLDPSRRV